MRWLHATTVLLLCCGIAAASTLVLRGDSSSVPLTLRAASGDAWSCNATDLKIDGGFDDLHNVTLHGVSVNATNCVQLIAAPAPAVGTTGFSQASYVGSVRIGKTYITVKRTGSGGLSVPWSAVGEVSPTAGVLLWSAGEAAVKYIQLTLTRPGTVILKLPGSTATLTVTP